VYPFVYFVGVEVLTFSNGAVWSTCIQHGKNKDWCKECGGRRLCEHQRQKHQCRECCALNMCPHKTTDQCVGKSGKERGRPRSPSPPPPPPPLARYVSLWCHTTRCQVCEVWLGQGHGRRNVQGLCRACTPAGAYPHRYTSIPTPIHKLCDVWQWVVYAAPPYRECMEHVSYTPVRVSTTPACSVTKTVTWSVTKTVTYGIRAPTQNPRRKVKSGWSAARTASQVAKPRQRLQRQWHGNGGDK